MPLILLEVAVRNGCFHASYSACHYGYFHATSFAGSVSESDSCVVVPCMPLNLLEVAVKATRLSTRVSSWVVQTWQPLQLLIRMLLCWKWLSELAVSMPVFLLVTSSVAGVSQRAAKRLLPCYLFGESGSAG